MISIASPFSSCGYTLRARQRDFAPWPSLSTLSQHFRIGAQRATRPPRNLTLSIVEEVRRFVARMPPANSTSGLACCPRFFSALGDQRAEILPVQQPPALAVGGRCMMRLRRILIFPLFPLSIMDQRPLNRGTFQNAQTPINPIF